MSLLGGDTSYQMHINFNYMLPASGEIMGTLNVTFLLLRELQHIFGGTKQLHETLCLQHSPHQRFPCFSSSEYQQLHIERMKKTNHKFGDAVLNLLNPGYFLIG